MAWISSGALTCKKKKTWWHFASRCCWNRARRLTCFLSASVTRKDLQFGTWTDFSFQRHYRFRPTTSGSISGWGLISTPTYYLETVLHAARWLGLWVRIPPWTWMSVSRKCCVLSGRSLCVGLITRPEESYRVWCIWVWPWNLDNEEALAQWGLLYSG